MSKNMRIAAVAYSAMSVLNELYGNEVLAQEFELLPEPQKEALLAGVKLFSDPEISPDARHGAWMEQMIGDGWSRGAKKDDAAKTHPRLVPFGQLPKKEQAKERILHAIVRRMTYADPYAEDVSAVTPVVKTDLVPIKYIGKKSEHVDNLYGTGLMFVPGAINYVTRAVAKKMLEHSDTYKQDGAIKKGEAPNQANQPGQPSALPLPNINGMSRVDMEVYAQQHFNENFEDGVSDADMGSRILAMIQQRGQ